MIFGVFSVMALTLVIMAAVRHGNIVVWSGKHCGLER